MKNKWMHMGLKLIKRLVEVGFKRFVQSVELTEEKRDTDDTNR